MTSRPSKFCARFPIWCTLCFSLLLFACGKRGPKQEQVLYVTAPETFLRDRVAPVYTKTGTVSNGDRVALLEDGKRWERVRNARGEEGWLQDRYLVTEDVFHGFQQLYREHRNDSVQARGILRSDFRLHLTPGRDTDRLFLLKEGDKVDLLSRTTVVKAATSAPPALNQTMAAAPERQEAADTSKDEETEYKGKDKPAQGAVAPQPKPPSPKKSESKAKRAKLPMAPDIPMEDWRLVRSAQGHAGWIPSRILDVDAPLEVAQYAEGQRIVAFFTLTTVHDPELNKEQPYYLVLLTDPKDGMPFDFNQARVFSWNLRKHRYELAYREHNIFGLLPASVGHENFEKLGDEPTFALRVRGEDGNPVDQKYRLEGVIVKRVLPPGESMSGTTGKKANSKAAKETAKGR